MSPTKPLHVVFGAGQVGPIVAARLAAAGHEVRLVRRSAKPIHLDGVQVVQAEAGDPAAVAEAARGAAALYHCVNPASYSIATWTAELPRVNDALLAAAARSGARLVVLDNLYALGKTGGAPMSEATPPNPCSKKGELRARLQEARDAAARTGVRVVTGRASDFYGPGGVGTHFAERFWKPALAGKGVGAVVNVDQPHTYHFIPDVAAGLAALGQDAGAEGLWHLPCQPAETTRRLMERLGEALGRPVVVSRIPPLLLKVMAFGMPILKELGEMAYQWEAPFVVDDSKFRARFGDLATPRDEAVRATVAWGRSVAASLAA